MEHSESVSAPPEQDEGRAPQARQLHALDASRDVLHTAERFGLVILLLVVIGGFSFVAPDTFPTLSNFQGVALSQSVLAVVGVALIFPLIGGRFDVSVGNNLGVSAIVVAALTGNHHWALATAAIAAVGFSSLLGLVNGFIVAYLGVNSIIATIGTGTIMGGLVQAYTGGVPIVDGLPGTLTDLSAKSVISIPDLFIIMIVLCIGAWFVLSQTPYGRKLLAVGSNLDAAHLTGLPVHRLVLLSFVVSGFFAGVGGIMQVASQGSGDPTVGGIPFMLPALAGVFLGGTTWDPGKYNVPGMLVGLFFVGATISGLVLIGVAPWVTSVFDGVAVVVAIVISAQLRRRRTGTLEVGT